MEWQTVFLFLTLLADSGTKQETKSNLHKERINWTFTVEQLDSCANASFGMLSLKQTQKPIFNAKKEGKLFNKVIQTFALRLTKNKKRSLNNCKHLKF